MRVEVAVVVGKAVTTKRGEEVTEGIMVCVVLGVFEGVPVLEAVPVPVPVTVPVPVPVIVPVPVPVGVLVRVVVVEKVPVPVAVVDELGEGGGGVALTDAASLPTVISTPQASGRVRVAEYTHVGFSLTPLI